MQVVFWGGNRQSFWAREQVKNPVRLDYLSS